MTIDNEKMATLITMLSANLELLTTWMDEEAKTQKENELGFYLSTAADFIEREGITLDLDVVSDEMLVVMYASYLYDKRHDGVSIMPRALRYNLNNRLFQEHLNEG